MATDRSVAFWQEQIKNGQRFQIKYGGSRAWDTYKSYYRHQFKRGVLPVNQIFSVMRFMVAQVYFKDPSIVVTPIRPGIQHELHARIVQSIDRWLLRELMVKYEIKKMIQDAFLTGISNGFNGYDSEYGWDPSKSEQGGPASLTQFDKSGYRIEYSSFINPGMPWFLRSRPDDVVWPWGTTDKHNAEWVAMRKLRLLPDLKQDRKYTVPRDLQGSHVPLRTGPEGQLNSSETSFFNSTMPDSRQWVELWQIHDAKTGKIFVITMNNDSFLRKDKDEMQMEGLPVETLVFNPDSDYIYGIPDARIIEPQLLELNEIRTQAMKIRRRDIPKWAIRKGAVDQDEIDKMLGEDVKAAFIVNEDADIQRAIHEFKSSDGNYYNALAFQGEQAKQDIRETVGFSRIQQGEMQGKTHITSTEIEQVMSRSDIRIDERRDAVVDLLTNIVRKFNQTIFKHWSTPIVKDIVGPDGAKWWLKFTGAEIAGEYHYKIDPANASPQDPQSRKRDALEMAKAWAEMNQGKVAQGMPVPAEIQRYFFSNYEGIDVEKLLSEQDMQPTTGGMQQPLPVDVASQMLTRRGQK